MREEREKSNQVKGHAPCKTAIDLFFPIIIIRRIPKTFYNLFLIIKKERDPLSTSLSIQHHGRPRSNHIPQEETIPTPRLQLPPVAQVRAAPTSWLPSLPEGSGSASFSTCGGVSEISYHASLTSTFYQACNARGITSTLASTSYQTYKERGITSEATLSRQEDTCTLQHVDEVSLAGYQASGNGDQPPRSPLSEIAR